MHRKWTHSTSSPLPKCSFNSGSGYSLMSHALSLVTAFPGCFRCKPYMGEKKLWRMLVWSAKKDIFFRKASGRSLEHFIPYQRNPNAHMCDIRQRHSQIYGFPGPFKPQYTQIWLEPLWRPYPIIHLGSKCGGITWDCCRLPVSQYYSMWHWANTETNPISVMTFLWADIMKIRLD